MSEFSAVLGGPKGQQGAKYGSIFYMPWLNMKKGFKRKECGHNYVSSMFLHMQSIFSREGEIKGRVKIIDVKRKPFGHRRIK